jgi:hypothetical protein
MVESEGRQDPAGEGGGGVHRAEQQGQAAGDGAGRVRRAPRQADHGPGGQGGPGPLRRGRVQQAEPQVTLFSRSK